MIITPAQRKVLLGYRVRRGRPVTVGGFLAGLVPVLVLSLGLVVLSGFLFPPAVAMFVAGLLVGVMLRNVALIVHGVRVLPVVLRVIDWAAVDRLLDGPPRDDPGAGGPPGS